MFIGIYLLSKYLYPSVMMTAILIAIGGIIYLVMLLILRDELLFGTVKKILKRRS